MVYYPSRSFQNGRATKIDFEWLCLRFANPITFNGEYYSNRLKLSEMSPEDYLDYYFVNILRRLDGPCTSG